MDNETHYIDKSIKNTQPSPHVILIDGSYFCFHRFHALKKWWSLAEKGACENPCDNTEFVDKFRTTFLQKLNEIKKKLKIKNAHMYVAKDCAKKDIWRSAHYDVYKQNRPHDKNIGYFFQMAYDELFKQANVQEILNINRLEADDCIALATKALLKQGDRNIYIIANDMDYLQLVSESVHIYNMAFGNIAQNKNSTGDPKLDWLCKIVCGDKSDNIPGVFQTCGKKTAIKMYNDPEAFEAKLRKENLFDRMKKNRMLIDFNYIPQELCDEINQKYFEILKQ